MLEQIIKIKLKISLMPPFHVTRRIIVYANNAMIKEADKIWLDSWLKKDSQRRQVNFITEAIAEKIAKEKRKAK